MFKARRCASLLALMAVTGCTTTINGSGTGSTPVVERAEAYTSPTTDLPEPEQGIFAPTGTEPPPDPFGPDVRWAWPSPLPFGWFPESSVSGFDVLSLQGSTCGIARTARRFDHPPPTTTDVFDSLIDPLATSLGLRGGDDLELTAAEPLWLPVVESDLSLVLTGRDFEVDGVIGTIHLLISGGTMLIVQALCSDNKNDVFEAEVLPVLRSLGIHQL